MRYLVFLVGCSCSTVPEAGSCASALSPDSPPMYFIENRSGAPARLEIFDHRPPDDPSLFQVEMRDRLKVSASRSLQHDCYVQRQEDPDAWACVERTQDNDLQFWPSTLLLRQHLAVDPNNPDNRLVYICMGL
ncbi:MAG: hypothetical protein QG626_216 [Patescibacteria group bacterium]|jgi:hypothetical protein|nr:hypothetical protein [Patescibacteria group bacterium]